MTDTRSLVDIARDDLASAKCVCGATNRTFSDGYAEIYDEAKDWLRDNTERIK